MAESARTVTALRDRPCEGYRCGGTIHAGEDYARHVAFPGSDHNQGPRPWVLCVCATCQAPAPMPPRSTRRRADALPPIKRPNGKLYRPRRLRVVGWDVDQYHATVAQCAVLGTHDVAVARERAGGGFRSPYLANPEVGWVRLGMCRGEPTWIHDDVKGAACVIFDESDDPGTRTTTTEERKP